MFENDPSAARGKMAVRELIVFKHDSELGNAPSYKLFDTVKVSLKNKAQPPRCYDDYKVEIMEDEIMQGVTLTRMI